MNVFKNKTASNAANNTASKQKKLLNLNALKHGGLSIAFTAIVLAVAIGVNVLFGFLSERFNLDIDISLQKANTLTEENIEFLKGLDKKVEIIVCCAEEDYSGSGLMADAAYNYFSAVDETGEYFDQTLTLLGLYEKYSENITVTFADPYDPSFADIEKEYSASLPDIGDIIVECYQTVDGKLVTRSAIIGFDDIYYLTEDSASAYYGSTTYLVSGNNLETELTSAIYKVTSAETKQALIIGTHCNPAVATEYGEFLKLNNFDVATHSDSSIGEISDKYDLVLIDSPKEDFLPEELEALDEWLYNGGQRGKGLMYLASISSPATPNLNSFLEEWGITYGDGILYETDSAFSMPNDPNTIYFEYSESNGNGNEYDKIINENQGLIAGGARPLYQSFEESGNRKTSPIVFTASDSVVIQEVSSVGTNWEPDGTYEQEKHIGILLAEDTEPVDNVYRTSYVMAFSASDFVSRYWVSEYAINREPMISAAKFISGAADDGITFTMKKMNDRTFSQTVSYEAYQVMSVIFQWIVPIITLAIGVVVFIRRARR